MTPASSGGPLGGGPPRAEDNSPGSRLMRILPAWFGFGLSDDGSSPKQSALSLLHLYIHRRTELALYIYNWNFTFILPV